jgi:hypothetical protein
MDIIWRLISIIHPKIIDEKVTQISVKNRQGGEKLLKVTYKPKIIFDKGDWINNYYKCKYESYLLNLQFDISNILKLTKQQVRHLNS